MVSKHGIWTPPLVKLLKVTLDDEKKPGEIIVQWNIFVWKYPERQSCIAVSLKRNGLVHRVQYVNVTLLCFPGPAASSISGKFLNMSQMAPAKPPNAWHKPVSLATAAPTVSIPHDVKFSDKGDQHDSGIDISENVNSAGSSTRSSPSGENKLKAATENQETMKKVGDWNFDRSANIENRCGKNPKIDVE